MKKFTALAALCAVILCAAGCKDNGTSGGSQPQQETSDVSIDVSGGDTSQAGAEQTQGSQESVLTSSLPEDAVVASSEIGGEQMNITFGDFLKEYKYYLASCGISDDTDPASAAALTSRREYIINYLINDIVMEQLFNELCPEGFTEEELEQIREDTEAGVQQLIGSIEEQIKAMQPLGSEVSDEELHQKALEGFQEIKDNCRLTDDDFFRWQKASAIRSRLTELVAGDVTVERSEAEETAKRMVEQAKAEYESDPASYDPDTYKSVFIPEGARYVKHILLRIDSTVTEEIYKLRLDGKDDEADALLSENLAKLDDKLEEVKNRVDEGGDFEALMKEYSGDTDLTISYLVVPGTGLYMDGFAECALGIEEVGGTAVCSTDYGYHIIRYTEPAKVLEKDYESTVDGLQSYLTDSQQTQVLNEVMKDKRSGYGFTIDREALLLGEESAEG